MVSPISTESRASTSRQSRSSSELCRSGSRPLDLGTLMWPTRSIILLCSTKSRASMPRRNCSYSELLHIREQALGPLHPLTRKTKRRYVSLQRAKERETGSSNGFFLKQTDTVFQAALTLLKRTAL